MNAINSKIIPQEDNLIECAKNIIDKRYKKDWHVVGCALRLKSGEIITGVNVDGNLGRTAVCAEAVALGRAITEYGSTMIDEIVAVYKGEDGKTRIVSPCGICREMISDYSPNAKVIVPDEESAYLCVPIGELLPNKYKRFRPRAINNEA